VNARQTGAVEGPTLRKKEGNPLAKLIEQQQDAAKCKQICQKSPQTHACILYTIQLHMSS